MPAQVKQICLGHCGQARWPQQGAHGQAGLFYTMSPGTNRKGGAGPHSPLQDSWLSGLPLGPWGDFRRLSPAAQRAVRVVQWASTCQHDEGPLFRRQHRSITNKASTSQASKQGTKLGQTGLNGRVCLSERKHKGRLSSC